jgi:vesicle-fusing ATPase
MDNFLVIGMTNRLDLIDSAVLRPGRFEVHIEVGLPDEKGRGQILKIHTKTMTKNNLLGKDVDLAKIAKMLKNYTGAEIEAVVKSANSFALNRHHNLMDFSKKIVISW